MQTFCFPGGTGDAGYGGHSGNEQLFSAEQIQLYTKYDLVMIAMINQTALHPATPHDGYFVPQATAMSIKQAAAIKAVRPDVPVFTYITGYLAQSTFEGGAKFAQPQSPQAARMSPSSTKLVDEYSCFVPGNHSSLPVATQLRLSSAAGGYLAVGWSPSPSGMACQSSSQEAAGPSSACASTMR